MPNPPTSKRLVTWVLLFVILALLAGCRSKKTETPRKAEPIVVVVTSTPLPEAATLAPTETPVPAPTLPAPTSLPSDTPTAPPAPTEAPTATPDLTATAAAEATQAAAAALAKIQPDLEAYGLLPQDGHLAWQGDETVTLTANTYLGWNAQFIEPGLEFKNFIFQTEVTWESSGGLAGCGFVFRAEPDLQSGAQYRFNIIRLSGVPAWFVLRFTHGMVDAYLGNRLQTDPAINQGQGDTNKIAVLAKDNAFTFFANGKRLGTLLDGRYAQGNLAYLVNQESGETKCAFNNAWAWVLDK